MITRDDLHRFAPRAQEVWIHELERLGPDLVEHYGMAPVHWAHLAGQIGHETDGLSLVRMRENMSFRTPERILEVYSYRLGVALEKDRDLRASYHTKQELARALVGRPQLLADIVYGGREGTPWMQGHLYIGRGPTQITHRNNYAAVRDEIRRQPGGESCPDLVERPEALESAEWGIRSAFADWQIKGLSRYAGKGDIDAVSAALNTGSPTNVKSVHGLASRRRWTAKASAIWGIASRPQRPDRADDAGPGTPAQVGKLELGASGDHVRELQQALGRKGYHCGDADGVFGVLTQRAVVAFQSEHAMTPDGIATPAMVALVEQSAAAPLGPRESLTPEDLAEQGSQTIPAAQAVGFWGRSMGWLGIGGAGSSLAFPELISSGVDLITKHAGELALVERGLVLRVAGIGAFCLLGYAGYRLSRLGLEIIEARVKAARSGANLGR